MDNPALAANTEQAKELIAHCRAGRLYEIEKWIIAGKSLDISAAIKRGRQSTLLQVAVETGFHSLVELIATHDPDQTSKNAALADAASARRLDLVEALLASGADIKSVPLVDVLLTWEPKIIRFFLDRGADVLEGRPFAVAFGERIRTALRPFLDYKRAHPELAAQLQEQLDCALRYFCSKGDLKWVSLLMWAGGDPRSRGPCLNEEYTDDPECYTSGLDEACRSENPDVLKRLKPDPARDNFSELLRHAAAWPRKEILEYLLEIGANPNDKQNGGSSALDSALRELSFAGFDLYGSTRLKPKYKVSRSLECVRELLAHGAVWNPSENYDLNSLRRSLLECEPDVTIELLRLFREHNACPAERVHKLLGTPKMKEHLTATIDALDNQIQEAVGQDKILATPWYSDQILPFDVTLAGANEYGAMCSSKIFGIEILNEGTGVSIDDAVTEGQATFVARSIEPMAAVPSPWLGQSPVGGRQAPHTRPLRPRPSQQPRARGREAPAPHSGKAEPDHRRVRSAATDLFLWWCPDA